jgi:hypothetical protein
MLSKISKIKQRDKTSMVKYLIRNEYKKIFGIDYFDE